MGGSIFRKKSLDALSSPDDLKEYLHVLAPAVWGALFSVILLLAALLAWSSFAAVSSFEEGTAYAENGVLTIHFLREEQSENIEEGMMVSVGEETAAITSVGRDEQGEPIAVANANVPDGIYDVRVEYKRTQILKLLFSLTE